MLTLNEDYDIIKENQQAEKTRNKFNKNTKP